MHYRLAAAEDLDGVCALIRDAIRELRAHGIDQWDEIYPAREDFEKDIADGTLYLALEAETLAAVYVISRESDEAYQTVEWACPDETAYILHRFCVAPAFQHRGIGGEVLRRMEQQLRDMGCASVRLDAFIENPFSQALYRKNGYVTRGWADWRKGRFSLMEKQL